MRLTPLDTNSVFQCLKERTFWRGHVLEKFKLHDCSCTENKLTIFKLQQSSVQHKAWETSGYAKQYALPGVQYHCTLLAIRILNLRQRCIQSFNPNSLEIGNKNLNRPSFKLKLWRKHLELQAFQQLRSMANACLGRRWVNFLSFFSLNVMKMLSSFLKIPITKKKVPFPLKIKIFCCLVVFLIF